MKTSLILALLAQTMSFTPLDDSLGFVTNEIDQAQQSIDIAIYSLTESTTVEKLIARADQGVEVNILADFNNTYDSSSLFGRLAALHHPRIHLLRASHFRGLTPQSHNKFLILDQNRVVMGSANLSDFGLAGAFDLLMKLDDPSVVKRFRDEFLELKTQASILCRELSRAPELCGTGQELYPKPYYKLIRTGLLEKSLVRSDDAACAPLLQSTGWSLLDRYNQVRSLTRQCLNDARLLKTLDLIAASESFATGVYGQTIPWDDAADRVYFSPEDNPEDQIARELRASDSVLLSLTLLSNRFLIQELTQLVARDVPVFILMDENSNRNPVTDAAKDLLQTLRDKGQLFYLPNFYGSTEVVSLHHRFALLRQGDREALILGSANWSAAGFLYSDEATYFTRDREKIAVMKDHFINLMKLAGAKIDWPREIRRPRTSLLVVSEVPEAVTFGFEPQLFTKSGQWIRNITPLTSRLWVTTLTEDEGPAQIGLVNRNSRKLEQVHPLHLPETDLRLNVLKINYSQWTEDSQP